MIEIDSKNSEFLIKLRNVIEPLKKLLDKEYDSLNSTGVGRNELMMLMESSRASTGMVAMLQYL